MAISADRQISVARLSHALCLTIELAKRSAAEFLMNEKNLKNKKNSLPAQCRELMKVGDRVRILNYDGQRGEIVEFRGPLGPNGALIYRVVVRSKPRRTFIELREDQLELIHESDPSEPP